MNRIVKEIAKRMEYGTDPCALCKNEVKTSALCAALLATDKGEVCRLVCPACYDKLPTRAEQSAMTLQEIQAWKKHLMCEPVHETPASATGVAQICQKENAHDL